MRLLISSHEPTVEGIPLPSTCPSCSRHIEYDSEARPERCWYCGPLVLDVENWCLIALKDQVKTTASKSIGHAFRSSTVHMEVQGPYRYALTGKGVMAFKIHMMTFMLGLVVNMPHNLLGIFLGQVFGAIWLLCVSGLVVKVPRHV